MVWIWLWMVCVVFVLLRRCGDVLREERRPVGRRSCHRAPRCHRRPDNCRPAQRNLLVLCLSMWLSW
jgi:hypothetical protein